MNRIIILIFLPLLISCKKAIVNDEQPPKLIPIVAKDSIYTEDLSPVISSFDSLFKSGLKRRNVPGAAVVIVQDTSVIYMKAFGVKSTKTGDFIDTKTLFRIGSLSKGFASVLTAIHVDEGCFEWNHKVKSSVPYFALKDSEQTERITLKHILSHSTGLPRHAYTTLIEDGLSLEKIIPRLGNVKLIGREGQHLSYQNAAYSVIEKVLEAEYDCDFNTILSEKLLIPIGMNDTYCTYKSLTESDNLAFPHRRKRLKRTYTPTRLNNRFFNAVAAGGVITNIEDMGTWLKVLLGGRPDIISNDMLEQVFMPLVRLSNRRYFKKWEGVKESKYALGWRTFNYKERKIVYHSGSVNNYRGEIAIDKKNKIAICVLFNSLNSFASGSIPIFFNEYDKLTDKYAETNISLPKSK